VTDARKLNDSLAGENKLLKTELETTEEDLKTRLLNAQRLEHQIEHEHSTLDSERSQSRQNVERLTNQRDQLLREKSALMQEKSALMQELAETKETLGEEVESHENIARLLQEEVDEKKRRISSLQDHNLTLEKDLKSANQHVIDNNEMKKKDEERMKEIMEENEAFTSRIITLKNKLKKTKKALREQEENNDTRNEVRKNRILLEVRQQEIKALSSENMNLRKDLEKVRSDFKGQFEERLKDL